MGADRDRRCWTERWKDTKMNEATDGRVGSIRVKQDARLYWL